VPIGASELRSANAINAITTGAGLRHQERDFNHFRSSELALAAKAIADSPEIAPDKTILVGPSTTFSSPITATHPKAAPRRSTP
jgi:hypothetical protein